MFAHGRVRESGMTYEEIIAEIENKRRFGNLAGVEIAERMLSALGSPQSGMHLIHIAGTNGKGSVSAFLCAILKEAGLRTGMFCSPHLIDFRERIRVDGRMIPKADAGRLGAGLLAQDFGVQPTMFDYCLAMALLYFKEQQCDVIVLETGLGGRLDSTNAVGVPEVSVITKIGYDHTEVLGDTLEAIAAEKAGIIKPGTTLVTESQEAAVLPVILEAAEKQGVRDVRVIDTGEIADARCENGRQTFSFGGYGRLSMGMLGVYQYENAAAALVAAQAFFERQGAARFTEQQRADAIRRGIANARWQGRMEVINKEPFLLLDGAHNRSGARALKESLTALFPGETFHFIMGVMADKDYAEMIEELLPLAAGFKTCTVVSERAMQAEELASYIVKKGVRAESAESLYACVSAENLNRDRKNVAFGSLYFIGEIEALYLRK